MTRRRKSILLRIAIAIVAIGFLSAFSYPLVQEGYERVGLSVYQLAQRQLLIQCLQQYIAFKGNPGWDVNTSTPQILNDLATGVDRDMDGKPESFLPSSSTAETFSHDFRIVYLNPHNFKVLAR